MSLATTDTHESDTVSPKARFTEGSTMRHVISASTTSAVGLVALFFVDLLDIFFIGLLGEAELAAAVGFAGSVSFFTLSLAIASSIAITTTISRLEGANNGLRARSFFRNTAFYTLVLTIPLAFVLFIFAEPILSLLGARGSTLEYAVEYFRIVIPTFPFLAMGIAASAVLRAKGQFRLAMYVTLLGGVVNAVLDPLFIFGFDWGLSGAALAAATSRISICAIGFFLLYRSGFLDGEREPGLFQDVREYARVFIPAALSNLSTPVGSAFVITQLARYGDSYVAGASVLGRITPVLFGVIFALSGAIGPIIGQNLGAQKYDRVLSAFRDAIMFTLYYVAGASIILFFVRHLLVEQFSLSAEGAGLVLFYATFLGWSFAFAGMVFVANAALNALDKAALATTINMLRNIVFLIPFVYIGGRIGGPEGILVGQAIGLVLIGIFAIMVAYREIKKVA